MISGFEQLLLKKEEKNYLGAQMISVLQSKKRKTLSKSKAV